MHSEGTPDAELKIDYFSFPVGATKLHELKSKPNQIKWMRRKREGNWSGEKGTLKIKKDVWGSGSAVLRAVPLMIPLRARPLRNVSEGCNECVVWRR